MNNCSCRFNCTAIAVLASIVIGIISGFLSASGILTLSTPVLWVFFAVATIGLGLILVLSVRTNKRTILCLCRAITLLLTALLGTILTAVILLVIDIAAASVIASIIIGLLLFFFSLAITVTACIIRCACDCEYD